MGVECNPRRNFKHLRGTRCGKKSRRKDSKELLLFPDLFPRFSQVAKDPDGGDFAHTLTMHTSAEKKNQAVRMAQPITHL